MSTNMLDHPSVGFQPAVEEFVVSNYKRDRRLRRLPPSVFQHVVFMDTERDPLVSGWITIQRAGKLLMAARIFLPDYERYLESRLPMPMTYWTLPLENEIGVGNRKYLTPDHLNLVDQVNALLPGIEERYRAAGNDPKALADAFEISKAEMIAAHEKYQSGELGRLARDQSLGNVDIFPQLFFGTLLLMRQKGMKHIYFDCFTEAHRHLFNEIMFSKWQENGVIAEIDRANPPPGLEKIWVFKMTEEQILRYLRQYKDPRLKILTPQQLQMLDGSNF